MNARDRRYQKEAAARAGAYLRLKRGYVTPQEKKAFKIAEKLRRDDWLDSLRGLDEEESAARLRAYRLFRRKVFFGGLLHPKRAAAHAAPDAGEKPAANGERGTDRDGAADGK